jgi:hypothetical protein
VRLGEHLREEELQEIRVVLAIGLDKTVLRGNIRQGRSIDRTTAGDPSAASDAVVVGARVPQLPVFACDLGSG